MKILKLLSVFGLCLFVFHASSALAYIGPGLGVVAAWALFGPIGAVIMTVVIIGFFPARYYYKKYKYNKKQQETQENSSSDENVDVGAEETLVDAKAIENKE